MAKAGADLSPDAIRAVLQARAERGELNKWYVPDRVVLVSEIPKTSVGKIDKKRIRVEMKAVFLGQ